jgi:hypothetical protein
MRRRDFITAIAGAAAWPLAARAQQPGKLQTVGLMGSGSAAAQSQWTMAFVQRMRELGWTEGRNLAVAYRWVEGRSERFAEIAAEFVRLKVDVILTHNTLPTLAAKQASRICATRLLHLLTTAFGREEHRGSHRRTVRLLRVLRTQEVVSRTAGYDPKRAIGTQVCCDAQRGFRVVGCDRGLRRHSCDGASSYRS